MLQALFLICLFIIGAAVGSFTSVVIYRLHTDKPGIIKGKSMCPSCETKLTPFDLIPIISYLTLRGKCRHCNKEISYMYPLLEIISGALFALLFIKHPFLNESFSFSGNNLGLYLLYSFYSFVLIFTFFFDLHYMKVADEILLPSILIGLIASTAFPLTPHIWDSLMGASIALAFFGAQILLSRGKWLGAGDLRVGAFMGIILGWKYMIIALFLAYIIGSIAAIAIALKKKKLVGVKIPFAPLLVTATFITMFWGDKMLDFYFKSLGL